MTNMVMAFLATGWGATARDVGDVQDSLVIDVVLVDRSHGSTCLYTGLCACLYRCGV